MGFKKIFNYLFPDDEETEKIKLQEKEELKIQIKKEVWDDIIYINKRLDKIELELQEMNLYRKHVLEYNEEFKKYEEYSIYKFKKIVSSLKYLNKKIKEIKLKF